LWNWWGLRLIHPWTAAATLPTCLDSSHYAQAGAQPSFVSEVQIIISHDTHPMKVSGENVTLQPMRGELHQAGQGGATTEQLMCKLQLWPVMFKQLVECQSKKLL
jgi:hypothetical protein